MIRTELVSRLGTVDPDRIVVAGVGNRMMGDDAIGPVLLDALHGSLPHLIDCRDPLLKSIPVLSNG